jgi:hypothetical protein
LTNGHYPDGTSITVRFKKGNTVTGYDTAEDVTFKIGEATTSHSVYVRGNPEAMPVLIEDDSLMFTYDGSLGGWSLIEGGAYSKIE